MIRASEALDRGDYESSEVLFNDLISESGEPAEALLHRAFVRLRLGKLNEALEDARRGCELRSESGVHWMIRGEIEIASQMYPEATLSLKRAVELESDNGRALFHLGRVLALQGFRDQASDYFEQALQFERDYVMAQWLAASFEK